MKKGNIFSSFKSKKFKYGGYATLVTAIVLAVLVVVNLVVDMVPLRLDMTRNQLYSLSEQTFQVLDGLEQDIVIYGVYDPVNANPTVEEIIRRYSDRSRRITTDYIDPVRDPLLAQRYTKDGQQLRNGSLVVESGEVFRVISPTDLVNYSTNTQTPRVESLAIEQRLTSAILYVSGAEAPVVYTLDGHGESPLDFTIQKQMELENYEIKSLNLLGMDAVPEDADLLVINSPKRDLTEEEEAMLRTYLENEGRAIFLMDVLVNDLPVFQALFRTYGIEMANAVVLEGASERYAAGNPLYLLPNFASHEITSPILTGNLRLIVPGAQGIGVLETRRNTLDIAPLMVTSDRAFGRPTDSQAVTMEKEEGDIAGPFNIAVAIEDKVYDLVANETKVTRMVVIGNSAFLNTGLEGAPNLFLNSLGWLYEREETITIRPKSLLVTPLNINEMQYRIYGGISVILIPLLILAAGLVVWLRRRHL